MADVYAPPFGNYPAVGGVANATAKNDLAANLTSFAALFGIVLTAGDGVAGAYELTQGERNPSPDFDPIRPEVRDKIGAELAALWDSIDAAAEV